MILKKITTIIVLCISIFLFIACLWEMLFGEHVDGFIPYIAIVQIVVISYCIYMLKKLNEKN